MTPTIEPSAKAGRRTLLVILVVAALLRLWGIDFGLPHPYARPDEMAIVPRALRLLSGDLNPHFFTYPSLYFYLLGAVYAGWAGLSAVAGTSLDEFLARGALDPSGLILAARLVTALAGVVTVFVAYRVGVRLHGRTAGLLAAALLAVCHLHVRESHFATTDVTLTLFILCAVYFLLEVAEEGGRRSYLLAGVFTGLAVSTKYVGLLLPGVLVVAHGVFHFSRSHGSGWLRALRGAVRDDRPWVFAGGAAAAFLVTSPFALLDWQTFITHFKFQLGHLSGGHGLDLGIGGPYHLLHTFPKGVGWPAYLAALAGTGWALRRHGKKTLVLLAFPLLFLGSTFDSRTLFLRYMLPIFPFLCISAAWWVAHMSGRSRMGWKVAVLVWGLLALVPLADVVATNRRLTRTDTRVQAAAWLREEVAGRETTVFQNGARWGRLHLPLTADSLGTLVERAERASPGEGMKRIQEFSRRQAEARLEERRKRGGGFERLSYDADEGFGERGPPEWIVLLESPLEQYSTAPAGVRALLDERYEEVRSFRATLPGREGWYDQHDAFYLPFKGISAVARPGPDVTLYRRSPLPAPFAPGRRHDRSREEIP